MAEAPSGTGPAKATPLLLALFAIAVLAETTRAPQVNLDLAPLYGAAVLLDQGRLAEAYEADPFDPRYAGPALTEAARTHGYPVKRVLRYMHPPALAAAMLPMAQLDFPEAALLFRVLSLLALSASAFLLGRIAGGGVAHSAVAILALLLSDPIRTTLDLGQTNAFALLLLAGAAVTPLGLVQGILLGLAPHLKTCLIAVPIVLLASRRILAALLAALVFFGVNGLAYVSWPQETKAYFSSMQDLSGLQFIWPDQQSLAAQVARIERGFVEADLAAWRDEAVSSQLTGPVGIAWAALVTGIACIVAFSKRPDAHSAMALGVPIGLLASPVLHTHYGVFLAVPAAWVAGRGRMDLCAWLVLGGILLACLPLHRGEVPFLLHYMGGGFLHWAFVVRMLIATAMVTCGVALGLRPDSR